MKTPLFLLATLCGIAANADDSTELTGDVNGDGTVNASDVLDECKYIIGLTPSPFVDSLADVDRDGSVDVSDATAIVEIYTPEEDASTITPQSISLVAPEGYSVTMANVEGDAGENVTLQISLDNPANSVTSFQMELVLPEGVRVDGEATLTDRAPNTHDVMINPISATRYMIICVSTSLRTFTGTSGPLIEIPLRLSAEIIPGDYTLALVGIELVRPRKGGFMLPDEDATLTVELPTGIAEVSTADSTSADWYTLDGRKALSSARGILVRRCGSKAALVVR